MLPCSQSSTDYYDFQCAPLMSSVCMRAGQRSWQSGRLARHPGAERARAPARSNPMNPVTDFDTFLDGESVVSQDLVAWVSMGAP